MEVYICYTLLLHMYTSSLKYTEILKYTNSWVLWSVSYFDDHKMLSNRKQIVYLDSGKIVPSWFIPLLFFLRESALWFTITFHKCDLSSLFCRKILASISASLNVIRVNNHTLKCGSKNHIAKITKHLSFYSLLTFFLS